MIENQPKYIQAYLNISTKCGIAIRHFEDILGVMENESETGAAGCFLHPALVILYGSLGLATVGGAIVGTKLTIDNSINAADERNLLREQNSNIYDVLGTPYYNDEDMHNWAFISSENGNKTPISILYNGERLEIEVQIDVDGQLIITQKFTTDDETFSFKPHISVNNEKGIVIRNQAGNIIAYAQAGPLHSVDEINPDNPRGEFVISTTDKSIIFSRPEHLFPPADNLDPSGDTKYIPYLPPDLSS